MLSPLHADCLSIGFIPTASNGLDVLDDQVTLALSLALLACSSSSLFFACLICSSRSARACFRASSTPFGSLDSLRISLAIVTSSSLYTPPSKLAVCISLCRPALPTKSMISNVCLPDAAIAAFRSSDDDKPSTVSGSVRVPLPTICANSDRDFVGRAKTITSTVGSSKPSVKQPTLTKILTLPSANLRNVSLRVSLCVLPHTHSDEPCL